MTALTSYLSAMHPRLLSHLRNSASAKVQATCRIHEAGDLHFPFRKADVEIPVEGEEELTRAFPQPALLPEERVPGAGRALAGPR